MTSDRERLQRILETGEHLEEVIRAHHVTASRIQEDRGTAWMVTAPLIIIGEESNAVSKEFRASHPEIPWSKAIGLRHRLVHDYAGTNWQIVSDTLLNDVPDYMNAIKQLLKGL